jgi:hypothetical protein
MSDSSSSSIDNLLAEEQQMEFEYVQDLLNSKETKSYELYEEPLLELWVNFLKAKGTLEERMTKLGFKTDKIKFLKERVYNNKDPYYWISKALIEWNLNVDLSDVVVEYYERV